ncbi:MAG: lamin tail domain-containing protein [Mediterranea sp.]|jgi:hypothetical protein|nr:lamin tail domain-containing protein [Mediterranea sp.]
MKANKTWTAICLLMALLNGCSVPLDEDDEASVGDDPTVDGRVWNGQTEKFSINAKEGVHLNDPQGEGGTAYISFAASSVASTRWELDVRLTFNPSANNYARFYLVSSAEELPGSANGYFVQIGGAKDNVALYRQDGGKPVLLAAGRELMKGNNAPRLAIKIERDNDGCWSFWTRLDGESEETLERRAKDKTYTESVACGIYCVYTKSRCDGFTFRNIRLSDDVTPHVSEEETPQQPTPTPPPVLPDGTSILFNEVMYDNAPDGVEYIELYNPTDDVCCLPTIYLYKMKDNGSVFSTTVLWDAEGTDKLCIQPHGYICFTKNAQKVMQKHHVESDNLVEVPKFPTLSNDGGYIAISLNGKSGIRVLDKCAFFDQMHDIGSKTTGISLEKRAPELPSVNKNWRSSRDATGGTPGRKNSE